VHEAALATELRKIVLKSAPPNAQVRRIRLQRGRLSCINEDSLRFAFGIVARGTCAEGATVEFDEIEGDDCVVTSLEVEDWELPTQDRQ
jgi:hydrogenase nickel incorporation protein HypA/HybF